MIVTKESGTVYTELSENIINFHKDNGLTLAVVDRVLTYNGDGDYVDDITAEELAKGKDVIKRYLYREYSDPIFFKYQRGEVAEQDWLDSVNKIKADWACHADSNRERQQNQTRT